MPNNQKKKEERETTKLKKNAKVVSSTNKKAALPKQKTSSNSTSKKKAVNPVEEKKGKSSAKSTTAKKSASKTSGSKPNNKQTTISKKKTVTETKNASKKPETEAEKKEKSKQISSIKSEKKTSKKEIITKNKSISKKTGSANSIKKAKTEQVVPGKSEEKTVKKQSESKKKNKISVLKQTKPKKEQKQKKIEQSEQKQKIVVCLKEFFSKKKKKLSKKKLTVFDGKNKFYDITKITDKWKKKIKKESNESSTKKEVKQKNNRKLKKQNIFIHKKWMITIVVVCVSLIFLETAYLIYHRIRVEHKIVYYDSLNSLAIDHTDIILVGSSDFRYSKNYDYTKGLEKAKFIKYDQNGKVLFEKMYEKGINTTFSSIISVDDGYVVVGSGEFSDEEQQNDGREAVILKYDKDGNIVWEKYYQVVTNTRFNKVIEIEDGYIAIGQSIYANMEMGNHTTGGGIIVKYDKNGNEVWHNNHGGIKSGNFNDVVEVNGDFYVVGKDATDSANLVKFNHNGEYQWHKNYSYTDGIGFTGIVYLDQHLYVVGSKKILPEGIKDNDNRDTKNTDALLIKYDLDGKIIFEKNFGGSNYERYNSILAYRDNLYVIGHTTSKDAGLKINTDGELMTGILVRYDQNGNILKKETLGGSNNDNLTDIVTDEVSLYISAYSNSKDGNITTAKNNGKDYFGKMIKLDFKFRTLLIK